MRIDVITLFPESLEGLAGLGVTGRAIREGREIGNESALANPQSLAQFRDRPELAR